MEPKMERNVERSLKWNGNGTEPEMKLNRILGDGILSPFFCANLKEWPAQTASPRAPHPCRDCCDSDSIVNTSLFILKHHSFISLKVLRKTTKSQSKNWSLIRATKAGPPTCGAEY